MNSLPSFFRILLAFLLPIAVLASSLSAMEPLERVWTVGTDPVVKYEGTLVTMDDERVVLRKD